MVLFLLFFVAFCFVFLLLLLSWFCLLVVLEFENGSREEEFCCFLCRSVAILDGRCCVRGT